MAKALGADIIDFYDNHWPEGYYHEDNEIEFHDQKASPVKDPIWVLEPDVKYDLDKCGVLVDEKTNDAVEFSYFFNKYLRNKDGKTLVVYVPNANATEVKAMLKKYGCKLIN